MTSLKEPQSCSLPISTIIIDVASRRPRTNTLLIPQWLAKNAYIDWDRPNDDSLAMRLNTRPTRCMKYSIIVSGSGSGIPNNQ